MKEEMKEKNESVWWTLKSKFKSVIKMDSLYHSPVDWYWFRSQFLDSNDLSILWLDQSDDKDFKIKYDELTHIVDGELKKVENTLESQMKNLI